MDLITQPGAPLTMSSREIADLLEVRHDNVKRTIETLASRGVIQLPQSEEVPNHLGQRVSVYQLVKRDTYVVVAQLSPEFTARLVDRWQQLEQAEAPKLPDLSNPAMLRDLLLGYTEKVLALEATVQAQAPKVAFAEAVGAAEDLQKISVVAKALGQGPRKFRAWLIETGVLMVNGLPFQVHIDAGRFRVIEVPFKDREGRDRLRPSARVTGKGITFLQQRLARSAATQGA